ncbi:putative F420-0 ABC transporter substrate-binding protein [Demequina zhanjiangensis]|uniref:F420-0 ABC transporter substrate-binding protein n=1 Tax=Demequina zhanjiangensis TaxID=3051659 RepID=A0ABT8G5M4_9MICO|nr:putative F420-0 ABC transporter substrate-binding protein [Demequina sp. SYSU T00b26]MDN4474034.1 putative F420-0 ABC transporter substrate-binding protein [Demequina sp. SYSU T00b26]
MPRHTLPALVAATAVVALAGCSATTASEPPAAESASPTATADLAPTSVDNCGFDVPLGGSPERIVTVKSTTTELVLELGLGDRIVGASFLDGEIDLPYSDAPTDIPVLSDFLPGQEAALALEPDLIFGGWESNFAADGVGERDVLADRGIASYVAPSACREDGYQPDPLTFDLLFSQIEEAGAVLGAEDAAATLVTEMRADLDAVVPDDRGLTALWYSSGDDTPYVGAAIGAPQMMMNAAGLTNIVDVHDTWTAVTWESVVAADPDVIVLVDAAWNTAESKIERLETMDATANLTAVQEQRYVIVPFAAGEAGVRNAQAVQSIVDQLAEIETD